MRFFALAVLLIGGFLYHPAHAQSCGTVNGQTVCTTPSGCGYVNGSYTCTTPAGCGYVNGAYTCTGGSGSTGSGGSGGAGSTTGGDPASSDAVSQSCSWYDLPCNFSAYMKWLWNVVTFVPRQIFHGIVIASVEVLESIAPPAAVDRYLSAIATVVSAANGIGYLMDAFAVKECLGLYFGALLLRFSLRRVPFFG